MNKIIISGRLTKDPDLRNTGSGMEVCNITVAVDRRHKKGEDRQADFVDCVAWGKSAAFLLSYFHKGDGIVIDGRLESRKWKDKDGNNRVSWEVQIENMEFPVGGKGSGGAAPSAQSNFEEVPADGSDLPF